MLKTLHIGETYADFKVKDPKTYLKDRLNEIKGLQFAPVEDENGKEVVRRIKVKSFSNKEFRWNENDSLWYLKATAKVKVYE